MAALTPPTVSLYQVVPFPDLPERAGIWHVYKASSGDTFDANQGTWAFPAIRAAVYVGITNAVRAACAVSGSVITIPAGVTADSGYVLAVGT